MQEKNSIRNRIHNDQISDSLTRTAKNANPANANAIAVVGSDRNNPSKLVDNAMNSSKQNHED